jgi:transcription elongation GreA/GreB family factor
MNKQTQEKIDLWKKKLEVLEKEYQVTMQKRGEAASMGDLSENSAYEMFSEDADTYRARMNELKHIIATLEKGAKD